MATDDKDVNVGVLGEPRDHNPRYFNGVLDDPEMDGLSLYQKKALLIDRELDSHGMGKYQVCFHSALEEVGLVMLMPSVVYILLMWLWLPIRPPIRSCVRTGCSCTAARVRILGYILYQQFLPRLVTDRFLDPQLGNIFSAFGAGLCAGVAIYQMMLFGCLS